MPKKGYKQTAQHRHNSGAAQKGRFVSTSTRRKISKTMQGYEQTADHSRNIGKARKGRFTTHGHWVNGHSSRTYNSYQSQRARCNNPNAPNYHSYGGRGIKAWPGDFASFLAYLGERPLGMTLDRIDNNGNYEPGNVRWATPKQQQSNRRRRAA